MGLMFGALSVAIITRLRSYLYDFKLLLLPIYHKFLIKKLNHKEKINVVFVAMNLSMWRYQGIYDRLASNNRFNVVVLILPCVTYSKIQQQCDKDTLIAFFRDHGVTYIIGEDKYGNCIDVRKELAPDIMFYPQPYELIFSHSVDFSNFYDKLLCYVPYAFWISSGDFSYNCPLHNKAWKLFYSTYMHKLDAIKYAKNKGRNVEVVGYPNADEYLYKTHQNVWKSQSNSKKRVIWAPHFSIYDGGPIKQSNFLWMADVMMDLVRQYSGNIQFAFKPHPVLYSELCKHKDWGIEKTEKYYRTWEELDNCQLETGPFVDLFMTSDAMIHDSGSFCVEYLYSKKPVMFISPDFSNQLEGKSEFGLLAMKQHYVGSTLEDVIKFLNDVVIGENDEMKERREEFVNTYLIPPHGKTVADNIYQVFKETFNC